MKNKAKWMLAIIVLACPAFALFAQGDLAPLKQNVLLDDTHPALARNAIVKASLDGKPDLLFTAMHNPSQELKMLVLERISALPKSQQAQLIARILMDDDLISRAREIRLSLPIGSQTWIQIRLIQMSYQLLGTKPPPFEGILTRAEATALATKLSAIM